jgi:hypothetical protein
MNGFKMVLATFWASFSRTLLRKNVVWKPNTIVNLIPIVILWYNGNSPADNSPADKSPNDKSPNTNSPNDKSTTDKSPKCQLAQRPKLPNIFYNI